MHVSEMDWTNKNVHPSKVVQLGDEVEVMVLEIDEERRRISLGMKQCMPNPWEEFAMNHKKGDRVKGQIKSITDFGMFIGLPGGIDGLVHLSDLSWSQPGEEAVRNYKKGEEIEAVVLSIDVERERISLGMKQLEGDPFTNFVAAHEKNSIVTGTVKTIDAKGAVIQLAGDIEGYLRASEVARDRVEDIRARSEGRRAVTAMIINIDRKNRRINLSIKAKELARRPRRCKLQGATSRRAPARPTLARCSRPSWTTRTRSAIVTRIGRRMTKSELIVRLAARYPQLVAKDAEYAVKMILDAMAKSLGERRAHRDPGVRQLRPEPPSAAHRPQSEVGRESAGAGEVRAAFQSRQGIARTSRRASSSQDA